VASLGDLQGVLSGTGCSGNTRNTGSPLQDKTNAESFLFMPSAKRTVEF
jgi:hypothetical protein